MRRRITPHPCSFLISMHLHIFRTLAKLGSGSDLTPKLLDAENPLEGKHQQPAPSLSLFDSFIFSVNDSVIEDLTSKFSLIPDILFPPFENKSASCNTHNTGMSSPDNLFTDILQTDSGHSYVLHSAQREYHRILLDDISLFVMQMLLVLFDM